MTGYQFIGGFMQKVTTLCHLIMVWPQTLPKKGRTQTHTRPYTQVRAATQHHAETRDLPSQDHEEGEVITLYQLKYWYGRKQDKREHTNTNITKPYRRVSEATQHYAETRDPPSQDPRDHIEQA